MIGEWFDAGVKQGATHMLVVCDTFDYEDYPVYVMPGEDPHEVVNEKTGTNMQSLHEVYALHLPRERQLGERLAMHFEPPGAPYLIKGQPVETVDEYDKAQRAMLAETEARLRALTKHMDTAHPDWRLLAARSADAQAWVIDHEAYHNMASCTDHPYQPLADFAPEGP